jgi:hypothetical protein
MHEFGTSKDLIASVFHISTNEPTHPIIGDNNRRKDFELTKTLQSSKCKENKLFWYVHCTFSIIRFWEKLRVMEPNIVYSTIFTSMYSELVFKSWAYNFNIPFVYKSFLCQVICLLLFIVFIVRGNDIYFFSDSS